MRRIARGAALGLLLLGGMASSPSVRAETASEAERLYHRGRAHARAGEYAKACDELRESQRLEPAPGTLLAIADCEEQVGELRAARAHFVEAAGGFKAGDERIPFAQSRALGVEARLARLAVRVQGARTYRVRVDGLEVPPNDADGYLLDPGEHTVLVEQEPRGRVEKRIVALPVGARVVVDVDLSPPVATTRPSVATAPAAPSRSVALPVSLLAFGALGLGVGGAAGFVAVGKTSTMNANCNGRVCNQEGYDAASAGRTWSTVSTVGIAVGAAAAGVGLVLLLGRPSSPSSRVAVGPDGISMGGDF